MEWIRSEASMGQTTLIAPRGFLSSRHFQQREAPTVQYCVAAATTL